MVVVRDVVIFNVKRSCIREKRDGFSEPVMAAVVVTAVVAMVAVLVAVKKRLY